MKLAVCSDIHDQLSILNRMLEQIEGLDALIFCGDFCAPFTLKAMAEGFPGPVHVVWGNNDGDQWLITEIAHKMDNVNLHGVFAELEFDGFKVAVTHYPRIGRAVAHSELYDLVCYGHNHTADQQRVGETLLLNPGELMGRFGTSTYAVVDTAVKSAEIIEVSPSQ